jgi:WG containing repeat
MKILQLLLLGLALLDIKANAQSTLIPFSINYKTGYKNLADKIIVPPVYDAGGPFSEGRALVMRKGKRGFIDTSGACIILLNYDDANSFHDGLAAVAIEGKYGYINLQGNLVIPYTYNVPGDFKQGIAKVELNNQTLFIDKQNKVVLTSKYISVGNYSEGLIPFLQENNLWGYININGEVIIKAAYNSAGPFINGKAIVTKDHKIFELRKDKSLKQIGEVKQEEFEKEIEEHKTK